MPGDLRTAVREGERVETVSGRGPTIWWGWGAWEGATEPHEGPFQILWNSVPLLRVKTNH